MSEEGTEHANPVVYLCDALAAVAGLAYLGYTLYQQTSRTVPLKAFITYHGSRLAERATAAAWDTTLKLRHYYRGEVEH